MMTGVVYTVVFNMLFMLGMISFARAVFTDPGRIPDRLPSRLFGRHAITGHFVRACLLGSPISITSSRLGKTRDAHLGILSWHITTSFRRSPRAVSGATGRILILFISAVSIDHFLLGLSQRLLLWLRWRLWLR